MLEPRRRLSALATAGLDREGQETGQHIPTQPDPAVSPRPPGSARPIRRAGGRAGAGRGGRGSSVQRGLSRLTPSSTSRAPQPLQSRRPASASCRHPPLRDSRTEPTRTGTDNHGRFQPSDARRACAHTRVPGSGLASDTCDQQVPGPCPSLPRVRTLRPLAQTPPSRRAPPPHVNSQLSCG